MRATILLALVALPLLAEDVQATRIRAHNRFLAHDLLEGRGVGTRGGDLATEYIATQFAVAGLKPGGGNGTYFQRVPLVGVDPDPSSQLTVSKGSEQFTLAWKTGFVGVTGMQRERVDVDAEAVFVGHGIVAPEYQWDDFKGVDVRGKMLVLFTNEPPSEDPKFFKGRALTYYGRWTYKFEQAARMGAAGCIIIHTTPTASYGWEVVRNSWGKESVEMKLEAGQPALAMAGWVTTEAGAKMLALSGHTVDELFAASNKRDFKPIPLGFRVRTTLRSKLRQIESRNVIGMVPGTDTASGEAVLFSGHWDHLGIGEAVNGDNIYNGAVDNASGCALLIEMANVWAKLDKKPRRSAYFIAVTAEESGLLGSAYYARHPIVPPGKTALALNFDAFLPMGITSDIQTPGAERTTAWEMVASVAKRHRYEVKPDARPEAGGYYRSDHFSFARVGIPAFSIGQGRTFVAKSDIAAKALADYSKSYHQPTDEYHEYWDYSGLEALARFGVALNLDAANAPSVFTWLDGDEFLAERKKSLEAR